jgi:hypothetical protein
LTSYLLIAGAGFLMIVEHASSLQIALPDKANTASWVIVKAPTLALMAAFTGSAAAAGGAWWARLRERASGTTMHSIGYGLGCAAIAGAVVAVLAWGSINPDVSGKAALASFFAALLGGVFGSMRVGGAGLGGLVAVMVSMLVGVAGQIGFSLTQAGTEDAESLASQAASALVATAVTQAIAVAAGTAVGCWWLVRRRRETPLPYLIVVGAFAAALRLVSVPIAWLAALPVARDLPPGIFSQFWPQQSILLLTALGAGLATAVVYHVVHRVSVRRAPAEAPRPAAAL